MYVFIQNRLKATITAIAQCLVPVWNPFLDIRLIEGNPNGGNSFGFVEKGTWFNLG
jgi:hypothetical protein